MTNLASDIAITIDGTDRTNAILYAQSSFETAMNAVAGSFTLVVRDPERTLSFTTGNEVSLTIDGVKQFGGYVTQVSMTHMAPAADTSDLATYELRTWTLRGVDYNIIFDRRIIRNTANYLQLIQLSHANDGDALIDMIENYADLSDFTTTGITNVAPITGGLMPLQQGWKIRQPFETLAIIAAAVFYIDANKNFVYTGYDALEKRWGFSDQPNYNTITASPASYQGATVGFREVEAVEDGSYIENDIFIWGGSPFASLGTTIFSRATDATSIAAHGRWQYSETHFGETLYKSQAGVDAQSDAFLNGPPGTDALGQTKGLKYPQFQYTFTWFADRVPTLSGVPDHLVAGDLVNIFLEVFGVNKKLPLRTLRISFPEIPEDGSPDEPKTYVQFDGTFGLQLSDPFTLWRYLLKNQAPTAASPLASVVTVDNTSTQTTYGAYYQDVPSPATGNGSTTLFSIPFGYISGTLEVYVSGAIKIRGTDYTETDPEAGTFTMAVAPAGGAVLLCRARTLTS